jgi:hypothetical protein
VLEQEADNTASNNIAEPNEFSNFYRIWKGKLNGRNSCYKVSNIK